MYGTVSHKTEEIIKCEVTEAETALLKGLPVPEGWLPLPLYKEFPSPVGGRSKVNSSVWDKIITHEELELACFLFPKLQENVQGWEECLEIVEYFGGFKPEEILLYLSIKMVKLFVQVNATGPESDPGLTDLLYKIDLLDLSTTLDVAAQLTPDGLEICSQARFLHLLVIAEEFLKVHSNCPDLWIGHLRGWWCIRIWFLHQRILDGRSTTLAGCIGAAAVAIQDQLEKWAVDKDLNSLWYCEMSDVQLYYFDIISARSSLKKASDNCGVQFETTGAMGKRTKFQQTDLPQLVVQAKRVNGIDEDASNDGNLQHYQDFINSNAVHNILLQDETRLDEIIFKDEGTKIMNLTTIQQCVLLAELNFMKKSQPKDELQKEEIIAYVQNVILHPKFWAGLVVALLQRSVAETDHFRTVERSMMQFENLGSSVQRAEPSFNIRYQFFHAVSVPMRWEIDIALGDVLFSLGQYKSALDIFLRLKMWENMIVCYSLLELRHKAEEVIREQITNFGETPNLLVYLGDATQDLQYYEQAWSLSKEKSFLSQQRLGTYFFKKQQYEDAIPYLQKAVELNVLEHPVWVRLGYAAMQVENWKLAAKAYIHANNLDDESFENWNNLAKATLKLGNKEQALRALKQSTKCNYDEWKVWENVMNVSLQCSDFEWTILSYNRLIDIKGSYADDIVLKLLVDVVSDQEWNEKDESVTRIKDAMLKLFGRVTSKVTTNALIWQHYSTLLFRIASHSNENITDASLEPEKWHKCIQYQQKAVRCHLQSANWDKLPLNMEKVVESIDLLCTRTLAFLKALPTNSSCSDFKTQAEFFHKQVLNSVNRRSKEAIDPTLYDALIARMKSSLEILNEN